jgi:hypothetical protein
MLSDRFSQCPAFLLLTAKERDKKCIVKSPNRRSGTKSKIPSTFCPALLKSAKQIVKNHSFRLDHQTDHYRGDGGFQDGGIRDGEKVDGEIVEKRL